jgi:hypothetical protein
MSESDYASRQKIMLKIYESLPLDNLYKLLSGLKTEIPMNGKASLDVASRKGGKTVYTIAGEHYSSKALQLINEKIRPNAEKNPDTWLFLIEGGLECKVPEMIYGCMLGKKLGIPIENPIKEPYNNDVIEKAIQGGMKPDDVYLTLSVEAWKAIPDWDRVIEGLSKGWDISPDYLKGLVNYLALEAQFHPETFGAKKQELKDVFHRVTEVSNDLSSKELEQIVEKHQDRTNIFACLGSGHKEILDILK